MRILVVEDFAPFRQFVSEMLETSRTFQIIGEVSDGLEAVDQAADLRPDLILLDIGLPNLNGIEAAQEIRKLVPESKIIFLTQESSEDVVREAQKLGAWGYIVKASAARDLLPALDAVTAGKLFFGST